ncbi:MAG: A/G-specific adenine glycosylase [Candidatus Roizmanbacteria bacterium]|nr:A/G-specific adenine glycosylase [Candidatus Roizmanbacteria bacterium]
MKTNSFRDNIYSFYSSHKRTLPWRYEEDPYKILVSEVMLQQTQVSRVLVKYREFLDRFPSFQTLADSSLADVLRVWQGMGYNRRGKYLKGDAEIIVRDEKYRFLRSYSLSQDDMIQLLQQLPGIGHNTACAVVTYSFNIPTVFVETNIRTVYLYHFFKNKQNVSDKDILEIVNKTLDMQNPREWYYALMDYGAYLKREKKFKNTSSKHYAKQSKFEGSRRQMRGRILRILLEHGPSSRAMIASHLPEDERMESVLEELFKEGLIVKNTADTYSITS